MATTDKVKGPAATAHLSDKELMGLLDKLIADGGQELSLERLMWKPENCGQFPVVGYIVYIADMPAADRDDNPDWKAFVIRLSQPTKGLDREGKLQYVAAGSEIVVPANWELATNLARFALDPEVMHELGIATKGEKLAIGGGKKMWRFRVVSTGKTEKRTEAYKLTSLIGKPKELTEGSVPPGVEQDKSQAAANA